MRAIDVAGQRVLRDAHLAPPVYAACHDALSQPGHLFSPSPTWARLFLAWVDDARGGRQTLPTILVRLYPDDPDLATATAWVLMQRFLAEAARTLTRLSLYIDTEPLWTLLPAELRAA